MAGRERDLLFDGDRAHSDLHISDGSKVAKFLRPDSGRTNSEYASIFCDGPASRSREGGHLEREGPAGIAPQARTPQPGRGSGLLRAGLPRLPPDLQPASQPAADADSGAGVEAVAEVALKGGRQTLDLRQIQDKDEGLRSMV
jgi:hypothetical protein